MKELPIDLHNRCRDLLLECDEFRSNESVQSIFHGTEIVEYVRYIHEKDNPGDRIDDLLKALENKVCKGKSVLALFLEALGKRQPDGDRTGAELMRLAHEVAQFLRLENPSLTHTAQADFHLQSTQYFPEEEKARRVLVIWNHNEAARIEMSEFLRGANLVPTEWHQIEASIEKNAPSTYEVLKVAFDIVQAVIVLFTSDEQVRSERDFTDQFNTEDEKNVHFQPEPDMLFKAGVASGVESARTVLIALGKVRFFDALLEQHVLRLTDKDEDRKKLKAKLERANCIITGHEWIVKGHFNNPSFY